MWTSFISVFNHYKINKIGKQPDHPTILNYILSEEKKALAIEIPIWKESNYFGYTKQSYRFVVNRR